MTAETGMRAWFSDAPGIEGLRLATADPAALGRGEALIRVEAAALNFSDLLMLEDRYQIRPPRPFIPGQEVTGDVVALGEGCHLKRGEKVASKVLWGGFADHAVVRDDMAIRVPPGCTSTSALALPVVYTTAVVALTELARIAVDETVLVLGAAGGVGLASVEIARNAGATVIAAVGGEEKGALALRYGASQFVDYRKAGWSKAVVDATKGQGADIIVDPVGGEQGREALRAIAYGGRYLIVGFSSGTILEIPANRLLLKRASAIGVYWDHDRDAAMLQRVTARLTRLVEDEAIHPHIGASFAFEDLPQALVSLRERRTMGKVVLRAAQAGSAA